MNWTNSPNYYSKISAPRQEDTSNAKVRGIDIVRASDVKPKKLAKLWNGRLAAIARTIGLDESEIEPTIASGLKAGGQCPRRLPFLKSNDRIKSVEPPVKSDDELTAELARLGETDTDNAQRFARRFGGKVIYTPGQGWLFYDGKRWQPDELLHITELAKQTARLLADESAHVQGDTARAERMLLPSSP
jgi:putative DNA primase/helicase